MVLAESSPRTDAPLCYTLGDARKGKSRTTGRLTRQGERQGARRGRVHAFQAAVHPVHGSPQAAFPSSPGEVESKIAGAVGAREQAFRRPKLSSNVQPYTKRAARRNCRPATQPRVAGPPGAVVQRAARHKAVGAPWPPTSNAAGKASRCFERRC